MSVETEFKVRVSEEDLRRVRAHLRQLHSQRLSEGQEEDNLLFDFPDHRLKEAGCALRLRTYGKEARLTFKGKVLKDPSLKKREELETSVQEPAATRAVLEALGLEVCFQYSKFREIHLLNLQGEKVAVCLDRTPVGTFVEIEGP